MPEIDVEEEITESLVVFAQVEPSDDEKERRASILRQSLKHIKWLANKRKLQNVVLHSFSHLGREIASPSSAESFLKELASRLRASDYQVWVTPFGYFCEWDLSVHGESLAKVWKEIH